MIPVIVIHLPIQQWLIEVLSPLLIWKLKSIEIDDPHCQHNSDTATSFVLEKLVELFFFVLVACCAPENFTFCVKFMSNFYKINF